MKARLVIVATGALIGCAACGFKGPLYLPQSNGAVVTHPSPKTAVKAAPAPRSKSGASKKPGGGGATTP